MSTEGLSLFDLVPGKAIAERFRIVRPFRRNDLASTFVAEDEQEGRRCEVTLFPAALFDGPDEAEEFRASWERWMRVGSPYVVRVTDALLVHGNNVLLVNELPVGRNLRVQLKEAGRYDEATTRGFGVRLLEGVEAIHVAGLVHGDIKPAAILVDGDDLRPTLLDGGVTPALWNAKHLGERTALIGTPFYAPIEQFGGESPDVQSDVYNVATVLFELVTGAVPWPGNNFLEVFQAKLDKSAPSMARRAPGVDVNPELERAIVSGLLADRQERYATAREFREALSAVDLGG